MHTRLTMAETASKLQDRSIDAVDLVDAAMRKARASRGVFISFIDRAHDDAVASARRRRLGTPLSPLDGIPFAVKDMIDVAGSRTTAGSMTRIDAPPACDDAYVVSAMRGIGMIPIGKTNLSEFAFSGLGLNPHFGTPTADFHAVSSRAPGGSSSGSAIAIQRGFVTAAIGTDTAGSVRVPAALNGLVGFRASTGRYGMEGAHPLAVTLDSLGPLARSVEDCVLLDGAMRGCANAEIRAVPLELEQVRFVVDSSMLEDPTLQSDVATNLRSVAARLRQCGACVEERPVEALMRTREAISNHGWLGAIEAWSALRQVVEGERGHQIDRRVRSRLLAAKSIGPQAEAHLRMLRAELMQHMLHELGDAVLVTPTVKHVAPPLAALEADDRLFAATNLETLALTMPGSFLDMPGVAVPSGADRQGLPTSVLFSAPQGHDDRLLRACLAVESVLPTRSIL